MDYATCTLSDKSRGRQKTTGIPLEGGFEPHFYPCDERKYCGKEVLFVTVWRDVPRYGGNPGLWVTTFLFRADTFELLAEIDGTATDVTQQDVQFLPEVPSAMEERFLMSCVVAGWERNFSCGSIDRKAL